MVELDATAFGAIAVIILLLIGGGVFASGFFGGDDVNIEDVDVGCDWIEIVTGDGSTFESIDAAVAHVADEAGVSGEIVRENFEFSIRDGTVHGRDAGC